MANVARMLVSFVYYLLFALQTALLIRAVLSWILPDAEGVLIDFLYMLTEPLISVVRAFLSRFSFFAEGPFDFSFFVTVILLSLLQLFFGAML